MAVEFVLIDWTRRRGLYGIAGAVVQGGLYRIVRPLLRERRGWPPSLLGQRSRWDVFDLIDPTPAGAAPPHLEDVWVTSLSPRRTAGPDERRAVVRATLPVPNEPLFGVPLEFDTHGGFVPANCGSRSIASAVVPSDEVRFTALWRQDALEPDHCVSLPLPEGGRRVLPLEDHLLLTEAEGAAPVGVGRLRAMEAAVRALGETVVVRLTLARPAKPGEPSRLAAGGFLAPDG